MSDLISRSALLKIFDHDLKCFETSGKTETEMYISVADMRKMINGQPTAYDVEKVVAELENASHWEEPTFDEDGYCNDDSWEVVYLDKATEIVRKGGIE